MTDTTLFLLEKLSFKILNFVKLTNLENIKEVKNVSSLLLLNAYQNEETMRDVCLVLETYRRTEFIAFLLSVCKNLL